MKISVITPSFNQSIFLDSCIRSVKSQKYKSIEHIIIDGGSTDGSVEIINSYKNYFSQIKIGPDDGQSDAINRGISLSTGDVVCWLNSDDAFCSNAISTVMDYFAEHPECQWVVGHCQFTDIYGNPTWFCEVKPRLPEDYLRFWNGVYLPQPSVFFKRSLWDRCGQLDISYKYAMDLDLWLRFLVNAPLHYINQTLSINRVHDATKTSNGRSIAAVEIAKIINSSNLNSEAKFDFNTVKNKVVETFILQDLNKYRSDLSKNLSNLSSYKLTWNRKFIALAISARNLIRYLL